MKLLIACLISIATANASEVDQGPLIWHGFFNKTQISDNFSWWTETQLRYDPEAGEQAQTLVRTGLLAPLKNSSYNTELGFLYGFIQTGDVEEHRLTFQHSMKYGGAFKSLSHRVRYELRTTEDNGSLSDRIRYLVRHQGKEIANLGKFVTWNEVFVNTESQANDRVSRFDRNRFFVGFRKPLHNVSLEFGYLNQWVPRESVTEVDHTLVLYLFF